MNFLLAVFMAQIVIVKLVAMPADLNSMMHGKKPKFQKKFFKNIGCYTKMSRCDKH